MTTADPTTGEVDIELDGKTYKLKPSLGAALALSKNNGIIGAVGRCSNMEFDTIVDVVAAGLGRRPRDLSDLIYKAGLRNINVVCIRFLSVLSNGGKPIIDDNKTSDELKSGEDEDDGPLGQTSK
jgi:hypothetical protein